MKTPDARPKARLVTEDVFASLIRAFKLSPKFLLPPDEGGYSEGTKETWGRALDFMARPNCLGAISNEAIRPALVQAFFDGIARWPSKQHTAMSALKQLEKWAIVRELLSRQITLGVEIGDCEGGHVPWTEDQVALAERHARADLARAITLGANTGQRGSDLVRMGPTDVERYDGIDGINIVQRKTKRQVWIPITSPLAAAIASWPRRPGPYLGRADDGLPWSRKALTNSWTWERDHNPALVPLKAAGLVLHGLRGHACVRLRRAAATIPQIADMVGMSEANVAHYCRLSEQRENASAAVHHLERTLKERRRHGPIKNGY